MSASLFFRTTIQRFDRLLLRSLAVSEERAVTETEAASTTEERQIQNSIERILELGDVIEGVKRLVKRANMHEAAKNRAYTERNYLAALLARLYPSGIRKVDSDDCDPDWRNCVFIDLPAGQISFHYHKSEHELFEGLPAYTRPHDGHERIHIFMRIIRTWNAVGIKPEAV